MTCWSDECQTQLFALKISLGIWKMIMAEFKKIKLELTHADQVLNITLTAPKGNVLDREMSARFSRRRRSFLFWRQRAGASKRIRGGDAGDVS
jgi:hypothetical protein